MTSYSKHRSATHEVSPTRRTIGARAESKFRGRSKTVAARARGGAGRRTTALAESRLAEIEDTLLARLLDAHPRLDAALDRLLADVNDTAPIGSPVQASSGFELDIAAAESALRIEASLVAAVIDRHPRRDRALDRLLADIGGEETSATPAAAHGTWTGEDEFEELQRARFDMLCDNDFDGLG